MVTKASLPYPARQSVSVTVDILVSKRPSAKAYIGIDES
jgi:hypothetical protein